MVDEISTSDAVRDAKAMARRLRTALVERGHDPGHSGALELIARTLDARDWNTWVAHPGALRSGAAGDRSDDQLVVPVLRMIDWAATRRFYVEFLGGTIDGSDDRGDHTPRRISVTLPTGARLVLSEHHDDATPGAAVLVRVSDLDRQLAELIESGYGAPPAIAQGPTGRSICVHDPAGNRIDFVAGGSSVARIGADAIGADVPPIVHEIVVPLSPSAAFDRFTSFDWWRDYGLEPDGHVSIDAGEVVFHNPDGALSIGRVVRWEPGARYEQTFTLAQDADHPSLLTVTFAAVAGGCRIRFEHGGWNAANAARRAHFGDWPLILARLST